MVPRVSPDGPRAAWRVERTETQSLWRVPGASHGARRRGQGRGFVEQVSFLGGAANFWKWMAWPYKQVVVPLPWMISGSVYPFSSA